MQDSLEKNTLKKFLSGLAKAQFLVFLLALSGCQIGFDDVANPTNENTETENAANEGLSSQPGFGTTHGNGTVYGGTKNCGGNCVVQYIEVVEGYECNGLGGSQPSYQTGLSLFSDGGVLFEDMCTLSSNHLSSQDGPILLEREQFAFSVYNPDILVYADVERGQSIIYQKATVESYPSAYNVSIFPVQLYCFPEGQVRQTGVDIVVFKTPSGPVANVYLGEQKFQLESLPVGRKVEKVSLQEQAQDGVLRFSHGTQLTLELQSTGASTTSTNGHVRMLVDNSKIEASLRCLVSE